MQPWIAKRCAHCSAPLKDRYREEPEAATVTLSASGTLDDGVACSVQTGRAIATAGLHPASGGDGTLLCSGDMLLAPPLARRRRRGGAGERDGQAATGLATPTMRGRRNDGTCFSVSRSSRDISNPAARMPSSVGRLQ